MDASFLLAIRTVIAAHSSQTFNLSNFACSDHSLHVDRKPLTCGHLGMDLLSFILTCPRSWTNVFIRYKQGWYGITTAGFLIINHFLPYFLTDNVNELRQITLYPAKGNYQDILLQ